MTVIKIVVKYLKANKFQGLYAADGECGCLLEDLAPCGHLYEDCSPGHIRYLSAQESNETGYDWVIQKRKPRRLYGGGCPEDAT